MNELIAECERLEQEAIQDIAEAETLAELEAVRIKYLGRVKDD